MDLTINTRIARPQNIDAQEQIAEIPAKSCAKVESNLATEPEERKQHSEGSMVPESAPAIGLINHHEPVPYLGGQSAQSDLENQIYALTILTLVKDLELQDILQEIQILQ